MESLLFLLFSLNPISGWCEVPVMQQTWMDTPATRYIIANRNVDCYTLENGNRIMRNGKQVFACSSPMQIVDFDIFPGFNLRSFGSDDSGKTLIGLLLRRDQAIYIEIDDCQTGAVILVKEMTRYYPWKLRFADVDGDTVPEVCLGVFKKSPLHPLETKRLFIFNLQPGLPPKWLGSRLSRPFLDFEFMPPLESSGAPALLFALEINQSGQICLNSYCWDSFGFISTRADIATRDAKNQKIFAAGASFEKGILLKKGSFGKGLYVVNQQQAVSVYQEEASER